MKVEFTRIGHIKEATKVETGEIIHWGIDYVIEENGMGIAGCPYTSAVVLTEDQTEFVLCHVSQIRPFHKKGF